MKDFIKDINQYQEEIKEEDKPFINFISPTLKFKPINPINPHTNGEI